MKMSFRWYGESDPISLEYISQIPGMHSIVSAVYDVKPGEVWPEESLAKMKAQCEAHGLVFDVVESIPVHEDIKLGRNNVDELLDVLEGYLPQGPQLFPEDMTSDQPERQMMAEIIREKLLWCLDREVPHGTAVEVTRFSERDNGIIDLEATIYCEKASHKGIIIGKQGAMLKKISTMARIDCEKFMGTKVFLTTWVKVKENWRDSDFLIRNFGYQDT